MHLPGVKAHGYAVHHIEDYEEQPLWPVIKYLHVICEK
jgi:hypothetical protein